MMTAEDKKRFVLQASHYSPAVILSLWRRWMLGDLNSVDFEIESIRIVEIERIAGPLPISDRKSGAV